MPDEGARGEGGDPVDKEIQKLKQNIDTATYDPRDVMLWAEYTNHGQGSSMKRIRDFNKTFDLADKDVKE
jgi:hypothetical protein